MLLESTTKKFFFFAKLGQISKFANTNKIIIWQHCFEKLSFSILVDFQGCY